jgi:hypothetical protein
MKRAEQGRQRGAIETLFTSSNYLFSTKTKLRKETLYFEDQTTKQTGRLRQEHRTGPLQRIDEKAKRHKFVSKKRYESLNKWHKKHPKQLPRFYSYEQKPKVGKRHIEFAFEREKVSDWHKSGGTVEINTQGLNRRIASSLEFGVRKSRNESKGIWENEILEMLYSERIQVAEGVAFD